MFFRQRSIILLVLTVLIVGIATFAYLRRSPNQPDSTNTTSNNITSMVGDLISVDVHGEKMLYLASAEANTSFSESVQSTILDRDALWRVDPLEAGVLAFPKTIVEKRYLVSMNVDGALHVFDLLHANEVSVPQPIFLPSNSIRGEITSEARVMDIKTAPNATVAYILVDKGTNLNGPHGPGEADQSSTAEIWSLSPQTGVSERVMSLASEQTNIEGLPPYELPHSVLPFDDGFLLFWSSKVEYRSIESNTILTLAQANGVSWKGYLSPSGDRVVVTADKYGNVAYDLYEVMKGKLALRHVTSVANADYLNAGIEWSPEEDAVMLLHWGDGVLNKFDLATGSMETFASPNGQRIIEHHWLYNGDVLVTIEEQSSMQPYTNYNPIHILDLESGSITPLGNTGVLYFLGRIEG